MIIQDTDQINNILTGIFKAYQLLPLDAREFIYQKFTDDMALLNNTSMYTYQAFKNYYRHAQTYGVDVENASILELGAGLPLGTGIFWNFVGARKYTSIDRYNPANLNDVWLPRFRNLVDINLFNPQCFKMDSIIQEHNGAYVINQDRIELIHGCFEQHPFPDGRFNYIYSNGALEHFADMERQIGKMYEVLAEGGIMVHGIDLRQHNTDKVQVPDVNNSIEFLCYSHDDWAALYPAGAYHYVNRLRASDYEKLFTNAGFRIIESKPTMKMNIDESVYSQIDPCFRKYTVEDLSITSMMIVLKK